ncbi:hypothetical protein Zm00014a_044330 [Zea mays]|uniref:FLZ-type domain-containing protein n=1 Tax=Zea mays TaxID=4577 RepID=A0A3L6G3Z3_MAIZE|nr:hypothetical protein Zm00014a_044330 [Zea mays]
MATSVACAFFFFDAAEPLGEGGRRRQRQALERLRALLQAAGPQQRHLHVQGRHPFCSEDCRYEQMHHDAAATAYARHQASSRRRQQRSRGGSVSANEADVYVAS